MMLTLLEWIGAAFAAAGTVLLALNGPRAGVGFVLYLASNACWIGFAIAARERPILAQNLVFVASSCLGIWKWLIAPRHRTFMGVYRSTRPYRGRWAAARLALRCARH
jgi:drug/metabolite transporter (DMT)-like permease